ncbi:MAG TPA: PLP-dependent aminotransferase family protein [Nocardioides sp.]|nr:PLP-dependent aminotransferase family protein [Nocardioides sp.]
MVTLPVTLDRTAPGSLGVQLSGRIRDLVVAGTLARGDRLPSTRALAAELGVSRSVTEQAYEQLLAEGWLEARLGSGTFVAATGAARAPVPHRRSTAGGARTLVRLDAGTPWIDPRHAAGWRRAWREVSTARPPRGYDDPRGLPELRALLADRVARTRGVPLDPDELVVTNGTTDALRHLLTALPPGPVAVEDPGYRAAVETVRGLGRKVVDLPVPKTVAPQDISGCVGCYVTPAHQHPLGRVLPGPDRVALLDAARTAGAVVVEDDYDSEFRYDVAPVPALASLDRERVAYLGTAAKSVAPSLRLGWLVPPADLLDRINARRVVTHEGAPWPVQRAFLALLRDGYVDKVVRAARRVYADRAPRVAAALAPYAQPAGPVAGMYSTWLLPQADALRAQDAAQRAGFGVNLLSDYCRSATLTGLVVGFGGVTDDELDRALAALTSALG